MFGILKPSSKEVSPAPRSVTPPPPRSLAPVPQGHYSNREELLDFAKSWAKEQGYAIVISRSRSNRLWLKCDRGGKYENRRHITDEQRKRKRGDSRLMGCPFMLMAVLKDDVWRMKTEVESHNHGASDDLTAHPSLRKMTKEQVNHLEQMTDSGSTPAEIMDSLRLRWPTINIVKRDVYNARKKHKENKRTGPTAASPPDEQHWEDPNGVVPGPTATGKWIWAEEGDELVPKGKRKRRKIFVPNDPQPALDPELQNATPPQPPQQRQYSSSNLAGPTMGFQDFSSSFQDASSSSMNLQPPSPHSHPHDRSNSAPNPLQQLSDFSASQANGNFSTSSMDHSTNFFSQHQHQRNSFPSITAPYSQQQPQPQQQHQNLTSPRAAAGTAEPAVMTPPHSITTRSASAAAAIQPNGAAKPTLAPGTQQAPPAQQQQQKHNGQVFMSRIERIEKEQRDQKNMLAQILGAVTKQTADA